jgi:translation initiation factor eIF-2B subunit beta
MGPSFGIQTARWQIGIESMLMYPADFKSPEDVLDFDVLAEAFSHRSSSGKDEDSLGPSSQQCDNGPMVHVPSPTFDYVPPHLISLFVTDMGGYTPSYVYRLLAEFYDRNDYVLSKQLGTGS